MDDAVPTTIRTTPRTETAIATVASTFASAIARVDGWAASIESAIVVREGVMDTDAVDNLVDNLVVAELSRASALMIGAGFVATPGFLIDAEWHMAWWLGHANTFGVGQAEPTVRRLLAQMDPTSDSFRDYTTLEWWRVPARSGARHITGPYVDYLCTDDYTLTLTQPVTSGGTMVGIAGADIYVKDIERILLPPLLAIVESDSVARATIVNASARVVVSSDPRVPTGAVLRTAGIAERLTATASSFDATTATAVMPCGDSSLSLVIDGS
jgi:hypothetical protein